MPIKVVASMSHVMKLAHALGQARKEGDPEKIAKAKAEHDAYVKIFLEADETVSPIPAQYGG